MIRQKKCRWLCFLAFAFLGFGLQTKGEPQEHVTHIPLFLESGEFTSMLGLNNASPEAIIVTCAIFNRRGQAHVASLAVEPFSMIGYSIEELTRGAPGDFTAGHIELRFPAATPTMIGSQVIIGSQRWRVSFDSLESRRFEFASSRLDGIAWFPAGGARGQVAITNVSPEDRNVEFAGAGVAPINLTVRTRETVLLDANAVFDHQKSGYQMISLSHDGEPGDVIATGILFDRVSGFSCNLHFVDRAALKTARLAGAGFRSGPSDFAADGQTVFTATLGLANFSESTVDAVVSLDYVSGETAGQASIPLGVPANETSVVDLSEVLANQGIGAVSYGGLMVEHSGAPGDLIAAAMSVDSTGDLSFSVPVRDPYAVATRGGTYPW
ncbi:MAG: hypothetical protein ACREA0_20060, partial [bacterium]